MSKRKTSSLDLDGGDVGDVGNHNLNNEQHNNKKKKVESKVILSKPTLSEVSKRGRENDGKRDIEDNVKKEGKGGRENNGNEDMKKDNDVIIGESEKDNPKGSGKHGKIEIEKAGNKSGEKGGNKDLEKMVGIVQKERQRDMFLESLQIDVMKFLSLTPIQEERYSLSASYLETDAVLMKIISLSDSQDEGEMEIVMEEIHTLMQLHKFHRSHFLAKLVVCEALPSPLVLYRLHKEDIVSLREFVDSLPLTRIGDFVNLLHHYISQTSLDDLIAHVIANACMDTRSSSRYWDIILQLSVCTTSQDQAGEFVKQHVRILQLSQGMTPSKIPHQIFARMFHQLLICRHNDSNCSISFLEKLVQSIVNSKKAEDMNEPEHDIEKNNMTVLISIFKEYANFFSVQNLVDILTDLVRQNEMKCDWEIFLKLFQFLRGSNSKFMHLMLASLQNLLHDTIHLFEEDKLKVIFLLTWVLIPPSEAYFNFFTANFMNSATTQTPTKKGMKFLADVMTSLVFVESIELIKFHTRMFTKEAKEKSAVQKYLNAARPRLDALTIAATSASTKSEDVDDAKSAARSYLEKFKKSGKVPDTLSQAKVLRPRWFLNVLVPTLLTLAEERRQINPGAEFKSVELLVKAMESQNLIPQSSILAWKVTQKEDMAKVRDGIKPKLMVDLLDSKDVEQNFKNLLAEFLECTRKNAEELLNIFCAGVQSSFTNENSKGPSDDSQFDEWGYPFVHTVLMYETVKSAMCSRVYELVVELGCTLDSHQTTCIALLLAYYVVTQENPEEKPTENQEFVQNVFAKLPLFTFDWMVFAAKLCTEFVRAVCVVSGYVITISNHRNPAGGGNYSAKVSYGIGLIPSRSLKILSWLHTRFNFSNQVLTLCSQSLQPKENTKHFSQFLEVVDVLKKTFYFSLFSYQITQQVGNFSLKEFMDIEYQVKGCEDFLNSFWKTEYLRSYLLENYRKNVHPLEFVENFLEITYNLEMENTEKPIIIALGKCDARIILIGVVSEILSEVVDISEKNWGWALDFLSGKLLDGNQDSVKVLVYFFGILANLPSFVMFGNCLSSLERLSPIFNQHLKNFLPYYTFTGLKRPHVLSHFFTQVVAYVVRGLVYLTRQNMQKAMAAIKVSIMISLDTILTGTKDFFEKTPALALLVSLDAPLYSCVVTSLVPSDVAKEILPDMEAVRAVADSIVIYERDMKEEMGMYIQLITRQPTLFAHVLFHRVFTENCAKTMQESVCMGSDLPFWAMVAFPKLEQFLKAVVEKLDRKNTFKEISKTPVFSFLVNILDLVVFCLASSFSGRKSNEKDIWFPRRNIFLLEKEVKVESCLEKLATYLLCAQPYLFSLFSKRLSKSLSFLESNRDNLFVTPHNFGFYPLVFFKILMELPLPSLNKLLEPNKYGNFVKSVLLEVFGIYLQYPPEHLLAKSTKFHGILETWMYDWVRKFGVNTDLTKRFIESYDEVAPTFSEHLQMNSSTKTDLAPNGKTKNKETVEDESRAPTTKTL